MWYKAYRGLYEKNMNSILIYILFVSNTFLYLQGFQKKIDHSYISDIFSNSLLYFRVRLCAWFEQSGKLLKCAINW